MKFDIITNYFNILDSCVLTLAEVQIMFPASSRELSHATPGTRIRVGQDAVAYALLDSEEKDYHEL